LSAAVLDDRWHGLLALWDGSLGSRVIAKKNASLNPRVQTQETWQMKLIRYGIMALALTLAVPAFAQTPATSTDMQILLAKVKTEKKLLVSRNMELTEAEAASFWPIYDAYQHDLQGINDRLRATIGEYVDAYNKGLVDNATAKKLLHEFLAIEKAEAKLPQTYVPKLEKVLPETKVARYIQIENKIRAVVRYELAARIPLVE
jgi:Spy/CpxP family protein refolding chaperone